MSATVVGNSPVAFTSKEGKLLLIPLSSLSFENSEILLSSPYQKYEAEVKPWLQYLVRTGILARGEESPRKLAMNIKAADPGEAGNNIEVVFSNIVIDPADPKNPEKMTFDASITEQHTYTDLSIDPTAPSFIKKILGTETTAGAKQGLVHVKDADTPSTPKAGIYPLTGGSTATNTKSTVAIPGDPSGTAFNLEAQKAGDDGDKIKVTISNVNRDAKTLTLAAVFLQTVTGIKLADLPAKLAGSGYKISVTKPNGDFAIPAPGTVKLSGGADSRAAIAARATALAI